MPIRTDVVVSVDTQGFQKAQQDAERLTGAAAKGTAEQAKGFQQAQEEAAKVSATVSKAMDEQKQSMASVTKSNENYQAEVKRLQGRLSDLKTEQQAAVRAMLAVDKADPAYTALRKQLGQTNEEIKLTSSALGMLNKEFTGDTGAVKQADKLVESFRKAKLSQRDYRRDVDALKRELKDLAQEQNAVAQALGRTEKGSEAYKVLKTRMADVGERSKDTEQRLRAVERATGKGMPLTEGDMARGAFTQGLVQGALPGLGFIQRGPGMRAQIAGAAVGRGARGVASGLFGGVQGMQQMLGAMPVPGAGVLAAQFGQGMSFAGGGLGQLGARFRAAPLLGGAPELTAQIEAARERAGARARRTYAPRAMTQEQITAEAERARVGAMERERARAAPPTEETKAFGEEMVQARRQALARERAQEMAKRMGVEEPTRAMEFIARKEVGYGREDEEARIRQFAEQEGAEQRATAAGARAAEEMRATLEAPERRRRREMRQAAARQRRQFFQPVRAAGAELAALPEQQALQITQQVAQTGGGGIRDLQQQGMLRAAFAAQTAFGVGPEVAGAFQMGGRRGAMVGAQGRAGETMADAIGDALSMGLDGSELTQYMQQMASGIETWRQTGMPINTQSIGQMGKTFAETGVGGVRGGVMAQGLMQGLQRISQQGITGGVEMLAAQTFGGFQGGGLQDFWETQKRLEAGGGEGGITEEQLKQFVETTTQAAGGGTAGLFTLREAMSQMGVRMGVAETEQFERAVMRPETMDEGQRAKMAEVREQMAAGMQAAPKGVQGLEDQARDMVGAFGKEMRRAANLQNKQNDIGEQLVPTFQNLQKSSLSINKIFTEMGAGSLQKFSELSVELTKNLEKLVTSMNKAGKSGAWDVWSKFVTGSF